MERVYLDKKKIMRFRIKNISRVDWSFNIVTKGVSGKTENKEVKKEDAIYPKEGKLVPWKKINISIRRKKYQG